MTPRTIRGIVCHFRGGIAGAALAFLGLDLSAGYVAPSANAQGTQLVPMPAPTPTPMPQTPSLRSCASYIFLFARGTNEKLDKDYGFGYMGRSTWDIYRNSYPAPPGGASAERVDYDDFSIDSFSQIINDLFRYQSIVPTLVKSISTYTLKISLEAVPKLSSILSQVASDCKQSKFLLVGYSVGAWVIQEYLRTTEGENLKGRIAGVLLYGDPSLPKQSNGKLGVARWLGPWLHLAEFMPYIPTGMNDRFQSWCLSYDLKKPMVNEPYTAYDPICVSTPPAYSDRNLRECVSNQSLDNVLCPHFRYAALGTTKLGADFLAQKTGVSGGTR